MVWPALQVIGSPMFLSAALVSLSVLSRSRPARPPLLAGDSLTDVSHGDDLCRVKAIQGLPATSGRYRIGPRSPVFRRSEVRALPGTSGWYWKSRGLAAT